MLCREHWWNGVECRGLNGSVMLCGQVASLSSISSSPHPSISPSRSTHTDQSKTHSSLSAITHEEEEEEEEEQGEKPAGEAQVREDH